MASLYDIHHGWIAGAFALALLASATIASGLGRRLAPQVDDAGRGRSSATEASVLALVGLFMAFTFSATAARFDARRLLVVDEVNAIGTAYLRFDMLPEPARGEAQVLLRRYLDARLEFHRVGADAAEVRAAARDTATQQAALWSLAIAEVRKDPTVTRVQVTQSLNEVFDVADERTIATRAHVPVSIELLLMVVACAGLAMVGYANGLAGRPRPYATSLLALLIALIMFVILDLDQPRRGIVKSSQWAMEELATSLEPPH